MINPPLWFCISFVIVTGIYIVSLFPEMSQKILARLSNTKGSIFWISVLLLVAGMLYCLVPHSAVYYIPSELFLISALIYALSYNINKLGGGVSDGENSTAYTTLIGIGIVLFATATQLRTGEISAMVTMLLAVTLSISLASRLLSKLRLAENKLRYVRAVSWVSVIYIIAVGFYILTFMPVK